MASHLRRDACPKCCPGAYRTTISISNISRIFCILARKKPGERIMAEIQEKTNQQKTSNIGDPATPPTESKIDPTAPAGSENSLGAESVRDGRPATDNTTIEAMDEESPDITGTLDTATPDDSD
jgi:hypothetical protein